MHKPHECKENVILTFSKRQMQKKAKYRPIVQRKFVVSMHRRQIAV